MLDGVDDYGFYHLFHLLGYEGFDLRIDWSLLLSDGFGFIRELDGVLNDVGIVTFQIFIGPH